ncbi:MAG: nucleobase:cation symporter-2 family protein [Eubacteriales bacterium]
MKGTKTEKTATDSSVSIDNIFRLDGRVPLEKAIPFGLQHILAMFLANISPILIVTGAAGLTFEQTARLVQTAMFIAGIATLVQLYPIWKIGAKLPIVMGVSFTFVAILSTVGATYGYATALGAILVGGIIEGFLGIFAKHWYKLIAPVVSSSVVVAIGFSLLGVGARSFGGGYVEDFGNPEHLFLGTFTLLSCLIFHAKAKGFWKQLSIFVGLMLGYIVAMFMGMVDLSGLWADGFFSFPQFMSYGLEFHSGAIISVTILFLVSATETIGDTTAMVSSGLNRDITEEEISGSIACDGFSSAISSLFGCLPVTSFSQNVGLIAMTKVVNRFTIMTGAVAMVLAGMFPPLGNFFASLPDAVLGGCTIMMFGNIVTSGMEMLAKAGFTQRNVTIAAMALSVGLGFTQLPELFHSFPQLVQDVFSTNCVAVVFVVALVLNLVMPKEK